MNFALNIPSETGRFSTADGLVVCSRRVTSTNRWTSQEYKRIAEITEPS